MCEGGRKESERLEKLPVSEYEQVTCWFRVGLLDLGEHWKFDEEVPAQWIFRRGD